MSNLFKGMQGALIFQDNTLVHKARPGLDSRMKEALQTLTGSGLRLSREKCIFSVKQVAKREFDKSYC